MLQFYHWFWITLLAGLQCGLTLSDLLDRVNTAEESMPDSERVIVRRVSNFQPQRLGREGKEEEEFSSQRSVLVSRVRVEVGGKKIFKRTKKIKAMSRKKPKSFLDSLFSKLKSFTKVTLSSKERRNPYPSTFLNGSGFSLSNGKRGDESEAFKDNVYGDSDEKQYLDKSESELATTEYGDSDDKMYLRSDSHIGIHTYSDQQESVSSDSNNSHEEKILEVKPSFHGGKVVVQQESGSGNVTYTRGRSRSKEARGRSLWRLGSGSKRHRIGGVDEEETNLNEERNVFFSKERTMEENPIAIEKEVNVILEQESRVYLLEFSNIVIIIIAVGIFLTIIVVFTLVLLCRYSLKKPVKSCEQVSDVSSNSSPIPQKSHISYNCEGSRCKQSDQSDSLHSLDSDYFLSSLEDISAQM